MLRVLRAFAWLRWRVFMNSIERTGARDTVERLSLAVEQLGPIVAAVTLIPAVLLLAAAATYGGYRLATGFASNIPFEILRYLMLAACGLAVIGPIVMPINERPNAVRLLLLPIPRRTLYVAQAAGAIADPWVLLILPVVIFLAVGLAIGGAVVAALQALVAGLLFALALVGLSTLTTSIVNLVVRDRRRGELIGLLFILILPLVSMLPGLLQIQRGSLEHRRAMRQERKLPDWTQEVGSALFDAVPSELYVRAMRKAVEVGPLASAGSTLGLAGCVFILHGLGLLTFTRLLNSPASMGLRRAGGRAETWGMRIPGLSSGASAVALAQIRLTMRTPRGRSILISPFLVFLVFTVLVKRSGGMDIGALAITNGLGLATFGCAICLLSILPFSMNQFAIDGAGLTLELLSPLADAEILTGKMAGIGLMAIVPSCLCLLIAFVLFPTGPPALWISVPIGLLATYLLVAPVAALLSALFPRAVDLNSIGRGSNAHGAAGFVGLLAFVLASLPSVGLTLTAVGILRNPALAPVLLVAWCAFAFAIGRLLFIPVRRVFAGRRENLGLVV
ncbi:MAG TPA: hypothetical protein VHI99_31625 [Vicinamibacterales bacterium]|jgi:hypothetical protein|nr:hypothetical protein [Vicinamibacterales bacterium]